MSNLTKELRRYFVVDEGNGNTRGGFLIEETMHFWEPPMEGWSDAENTLETHFSQVLSVAFREVRKLSRVGIAERDFFSDELADSTWKHLTELALEYEYLRDIEVLDKDTSMIQLLDKFDEDEEKIIDIFIEQWESVTKGGDQK